MFLLVVAPSQLLLTTMCCSLEMSLWLRFLLLVLLLGLLLGLGLLGLLGRIVVVE